MRTSGVEPGTLCAPPLMRTEQVKLSPSSASIIDSDGTMSAIIESKMPASISGLSTSPRRRSGVSSHETKGRMFHGTCLTSVGAEEAVMGSSTECSSATRGDSNAFSHQKAATRGGLTPPAK